MSSKDFAGLPVHETSMVSLEKLQSCKLFTKLNDEAKTSLLQFEDRGYGIIRNYLPEGLVDAVNAEISSSVQEKILQFNSSNKLMFAIHISDMLKSIGGDEQLKELLSCLLDDLRFSERAIDKSPADQQ